MKMTIPVRALILKPWLKQGTITLIHASRGVGKTWFGLVLATAITREAPIGPWEVENPVDCLYLDGEMAADELQSRITWLSADKSAGQAKLGILCADLLNSQNHPTPNLKEENWRKEIKKFSETTCVIQSAHS